MNNVEVAEGILGMFAIGVGYVAILLPALIVLIVFLYRNKDKKNRYEAVVAVSKNIEDPSEIKELLNDLKEKKQPIDYRRSGVITLGVGVGLFLFGLFINEDVFMGVGALVAAIGVGQIVAGYLYPNTSEELTNAVEDYEKK
ncbi:DUF6249 domain-containing protein [Gammaproteobacteria bacterium]|nr:DUF6249 domain-containing protein [Gammaproteobacteria bacterium]MDB9763521.1 DUF6249 domain-containing protein [Gammaproteobacteria bacterium]MDC3384234.1 DUF6249 domain-containing protein [Gammaproteobacteria bacterium]